eukprot:5858490-Alexandrium_andersonii.AAC.1
MPSSDTKKEKEPAAAQRGRLSCGSMLAIPAWQAHEAHVGPNPGLLTSGALDNHWKDMISTCVSVHC